MTPTRWALAVLAVLAGIAAWLYGRREPDPRPATASVAALPLPWPTPGSAPEASPTPRTAEPAARPAGLVPPPAAAAPPRVGSEGYGPHIERAYEGDDGYQAWQAARLLLGCATTERRRQSAEQMRGQGNAVEMMTQLMVEIDEEARRCQTVTARHQALFPELARRAMRAGAPGAASAYAASVAAPDRLPAAEREEVVTALRRDALAGQTSELFFAVISPEAWGISDDERLSFLYAFGELTDRAALESQIPLLIEQRRIPFKTPPTPEQWAAAEVAGRRIADRIRGESREP